MARALVLLWQPAPFAIGTVALALIALLSGRPRLALAGPISCVVALGLTEVVLKPLVARHHLQRISPVFPSGHVTAAAAWAMFAWLVFERFAVLRSVLVFVPVLVGWAVVSFGYHYPADAVVGLLVGGVVVHTIAAGVERVRPVAPPRRELALVEPRHIHLPVAEDRAPVRV
jgi:membrane-associated phospholipid phosphatase